jgi:hypothetical protein
MLNSRRNDGLARAACALLGQSWTDVDAHQLEEYDGHIVRAAELMVARASAVFAKRALTVVKTSSQNQIQSISSFTHDMIVDALAL